MSQKTDNINNFLNTFKGKIIGAICGMIVVFLVAKWDAVVETFNAGENIQKEQEFNTDLIKAFNTDSVTDALMSNEEFAKKILNHPVISKYVEKVGVELHNRIRNQIVEDVIKNDTNKISMRSFVGKEADIRDEQVLPLLAEIIKAYKEKEFAKKKDVKNIIKQEIKPTSLKRPIALF